MGAAKTESATTASKARFISSLHGQNQRSGLRLLILHVGSSRCLEKYRRVLIKIVHSMRVTCRPSPRPSFGIPHSHPCASWSGSKRLFARLVSSITGARRAGRNSAGPRQLTISSATDDNSYLSLCPFMAEAVEELFRRRSRATLIQRKRRPRNIDSRNYIC